MQAETMPAGRENGRLQLENEFVGQPGAIGKKARHAPHRRGQALIGVQSQADVKRACEHG